MSVVRIAGAQLENVVGDLEGNRRRIVDAMRWAEEERAELLVLPELTLTGYPPQDLVLREEFVEAADMALARVAEESRSTTTVVGTIDVIPAREAGDTRRRTLAISAALVWGGRVRGSYHKVLLPNYDTFDEARNFAAGDEPGALWRMGDAVVGVAICEDAWSDDGPPEAQAAGGAQLLLLPNASPFHRDKPQGRRALVEEVARRTGLPVVYVNCVGGQDELVFDGGSLVVDGDGCVIFTAEQFEPQRFCLDVPLRARPLTAPVRTIHARIVPPRKAEPAPPSAPQLDPPAQVWQALVLGTRDYAHKNDYAAAVLGLSGGIDSAVTACVAVDALGPENVLALAMPAEDSPSAELEDARRLAENLGIGFEVIPIGRAAATATSCMSTLLSDAPWRSTSEDLHSRIRGAMLVTIADELAHLALAAGNRTELSIGQGVLYGDMAGEFAPLKDCPKTLLYELARHRNTGARGRIPERTIERVPSAQRGDSNLPSYEVLDAIVERYVEHREGLERIAAAGFDPATVRGVLQLVDHAEFQRRQTPPGVKITTRAFVKDLRMPITNAWQPFRRDEVELQPPPPARP